MIINFTNGINDYKLIFFKRLLINIQTGVVFSITGKKDVGLIALLLIAKYKNPDKNLKFKHSYFRKKLADWSIDYNLPFMHNWNWHCKPYLEELGLYKFIFFRKKMIYLNPEIKVLEISLG